MRTRLSRQEVIDLNIDIREYKRDDIPHLIAIWNEVIEDGQAFPQEACLDLQSGTAFFSDQDYTAVAVDRRETVLGLYILHANNIGRCGHIANTSYAVRKDLRGLGIGGKLVRDSLIQAARLGFCLMQFNAVVKNNHGAMRLYEKLGFIRLGVIPGGFRLKDGRYEDMYPYYKILERVDT